MGKTRVLALVLVGALVLLAGTGACGGNGGKTLPPAEIEMELTSAAFAAGGAIPVDYTCDGQDISPELSWSDAPEGTQSFALIVDDPDSPGGDFTHWIIFNIPADTSKLVTAISTATDLSVILWQGKNDFGSIGYRGPCPPSGQTHHYRFTVYALDTTLGLSSGATRSQLVDAMQGHVLAQGELIASYQR